MYTALVVASSALLLGGVFALARGLFMFASHSSLTTSSIVGIKKSFAIGGALVIGGTGVYSSTVLLGDSHEPELIRATTPQEETGITTLESIPRGPIGND